MQNKVLKNVVVLAVALISARDSYAVSEAGEIQRKENSAPYAAVNMTQNITDISGPDVTDPIEEINFSADELVNDDKNGVITASGKVEIIYNKMRLQTDKLIYNQKEDTVTAVDNVRMYTSDGSVIFSDNVVLSEQMSVGEMNNIKVLLADESHVWAEKFKKKNNKTKILNNVVYTPCDLCEGKSPLWRISARKVQHDEETKNINYNDAVLRFKDVPVFYSPFFSHPDPSVKRRSGWLTPTIGSSNYLGATIQPRYFWAVNDNTNLLFNPILSSDKNVVWSGLYRQYFYSGNTSISGTYLKDDENNRLSNRGNLFAGGRQDINDYWRMNYDLKYVSDYIYLKELGLPYKDDAWLTSNISFERFSGRDYASVEAYYYKILSYNLRIRNESQYRELSYNKPYVAPLVEVETYSDPSSIGSYFKNEFNGASVYRKDGSQTQRLTSINSWQLPYTSAYGEKYRFVASVKSDAYYVNRYQYANDNTYTGTTARIFPQAGVEWRLPFVRATDDSRQIAEPIIVGVLAPSGGNKINKIPNEDSEDVYFDDTNVLDLDRYAGYDRNDTGSRLSYGMRWSSYGDITGRTSAFVAQTYEYNDNSSFVSSLDNENKSRFSDLVGRVDADPNQYFNMNYRFRLDKKTLDAKYSELGVGVGPSFLRASASYIFLQGNTHYNKLYSERKELYLSLKAELSQNWSVSVYNLQDMTENSRGSLEHGGNIIYDDECFSWVTDIRKYNSSNPDLDNDYEFGMTFYLKTVGSFGS